MDWLSVLCGIGVGMAIGFFFSCCMGLSKEADRQAELDFMRLKFEEAKRQYELHKGGLK